MSQSHAEPRYLDLPNNRRIAYHKLEASGTGNARPTVVFLGGFRSDMTGTKAVFLQQWAQENGLGFLRFDYSGHGQSSGRFEDGCIGDWASDAIEALDALTTGKLILVGSSMGGWISCLVTRAMGARIAGFVGIAAAPDFTEDSMWSGMSAAQRAQMADKGQIEIPSEYGEPLVLTRRLIEDGRNQLVLRSPLVFDCPVRLLHGTADADVAPSVGLRLLEHMQSPDAQLIFVKDADHRMSSDRDLALIADRLRELIGL
ncbi:MAG: alpha/beta hydrolase [Neomegalonema sp.]|nr:alpha/beta hydrolase [Neomegalonema sp.]